MRRPAISDERGVIALEFMLVIGTLILVFLVMLQFAVRVHAQHIASAAAREGLSSAAAYDGSAHDGEATTRRYLERLNPGLEHATVQVTRYDSVAVVTVTGTAAEFLPLLDVDIEVRVQRPVEHFVEEP